MQALMKQAAGYDNMALVDIPVPEVSGDLVQVRVAYAGICGTDIHTYKGEYAATTIPVVLGHELSGVVSAVGPDVQSVHVGDRVTSETTYSTCGTCPACLNHEYNLCATRRGIGTQVNGAMAEYVINREESIHVLPENVSLLAGAVTEPLACGIHAVIEKASVKPEQLCVIFGAGTIGQVVAAVAKAQGACVVMAGLSQDKDRFAIAQGLGVDRCVDQQSENLQEVIAELTDGQGADVVFECSGAAPAINTALDVVKRKGKVIQEGVFPHETTPLALNTIMNKEIVYQGSRTQKPSSWELALDFMNRGRVDVEQLVTSRHSLTDWRDGFDLMMRGEGMKAIIVCNSDFNC